MGEKAAAFCIGGPDLEEKEDYFMSLNGIIRIIKDRDMIHAKDIWILVFEDLESARAAQWQLELNGAEGRSEA